MQHLKIFIIILLGYFLIGLPAHAQEEDTSSNKCVIRSGGKRKTLRFTGGSITGFNDSDALGTAFDPEEYPLTEAELLENPDEPRYEIKFNLEETKTGEDDATAETKTMTFVLELAVLSNGRNGSEFFLEPELELADNLINLPFSRLHIKNYGVAYGDLKTTAYADDLVGPFKPFELKEACDESGDCDEEDIERRTNQLKMFISEFVLTETDIPDPDDPNLSLGLSREGTVTGSFRLTVKNARKMKTGRFNVLRGKFGLIGKEKYQKKIEAESQPYGTTRITCRFTDLPYSENITVIDP